MGQRVRWIWVCQCTRLCHCCGAGSIPGGGTSTCHSCCPPKKKLVIKIGIELPLLFLSQMLSRAKPAVGGDLPHTDRRKKKGRKIPKLEELLSQRDFTGAITLLEVMSREGCFLRGE